MTEERLHELVRNGETLHIEFKSDRGPLPDRDLVEAVVCLANAEGGTLLLGVENDGAITGLHPRHQKVAPSHLVALIASRTEPPFSVEAIPVTTAQGCVLVIQVPRALLLQPVATSDGRVLMRSIGPDGDPLCRPLYPHQVLGWQAYRGAADPSARLLAGAAWDSLDPLEFARLRRLVEENRGDSALLALSDDELALALGLIQRHSSHPQPTLAGLLLVGKEQALRTHVPAHETAFQVLRGVDVVVNDIRRWPLLRTVEWINEAFNVRVEEREFQRGLFRVGVPSYDRRGFREAVNNALLHRDYTRLGATHVQIHDDHIRISNSGGFVEGLSPSNLLVIGPRPRNPLLADAFKRIGLVERVGRGVEVIYRGQLRNGLQPPDYSRSDGTHVVVRLPGGANDLQLVELIVAEEQRLQKTFTVGDLLVLSHVWRERSITSEYAATLTQKERGEARATLEQLVESGIVERRGGREGDFILSAAVYRTMGRPADYIHLQGIDGEEIMKMQVMRYIRAHDRVTRTDVMSLCRLTPNQASYLLKKMVDKGEIRLATRGQKAYYVLPGH